VHAGTERLSNSSLRSGKGKEHSEYVMYLTCEDALSALSLWVLERVHEVRETADGDGTKTGVEVRLACEPNGSDGCHRENSLHALLQYNLVRASSADLTVSGRSCCTWPFVPCYSVTKSGQKKLAYFETSTTVQSKLNDVFSPGFIFEQ
jgi:hypothetical protein